MYSGLIVSKRAFRQIAHLAIAAMILVLIYPSAAYAAWDLEYQWTTGDISPRLTGPAAVYDREQTGSSVHFLAPVQHGLSSYDSSGTFEWTFTGLTLAYDIYTIVAGDLRGTGYNDTIVVGGGFNSSTGYQIGILDEDGGVIQRIKLTNGNLVRHLALDGTDIYAATDYGVTKLVKSGSTWAEDWSVALSSGALHVAVDDMGNGKRVYTVRNGAAYSLYPADGSQEWTATTGSYTSQFRIGKINNSVTGKQMVVPRQTATNVIDKDGNSLGTISTGTNVRTGVTLYDADGDGEEEIYISDMGDDIYVWEPSSTNTYTQKYSLIDAISQPGLEHFDINGDGTDEIIVGSDDGTFAIMTADLSATLMSTSTGHGNMGGHNMGGLLGNKMNGTLFTDINGDGHEDLVISGGNGYLDAWLSTGLADPEPPSGDTVIFLTSGSSWTVPADWNSASNTIEVIGGGGGGGGGRSRPVLESPQGGGGGGGGAYAKIANVSLTPSGSVSYSIGTAGSAGAASGAGDSGGDTWFSSTGTLLAKGGSGGSDPSVGTGGAGGNAGSSVGSVTHNGGAGGNGSTGTGGSAGGGGAAGPNGNGNNGGGSGSPSGGSGDAGYGGAGGTGSASPTAGGDGTEWDATHGSGGGAGGNNSSSANGLAGGNYGGGGSGGSGPGSLGGVGAPGLIVITYSAGSGEEISPRELRLRGGVRLKGGVRLR